MWLLHSSIGRKLVMSITGIALVLFLLFHLSMNVAAVFSADAYNMICAFLGANWYAVVATGILGFLVFLHIAYSMMITWQNRKARGNDRYAVNSRPKGVSWASQNMFVLGKRSQLGFSKYVCFGDDCVWFSIVAFWAILV